MAKQKSPILYTEPDYVQIANLVERPRLLDDSVRGINDTYYGSITLPDGSEQKAYIKRIPPDEIFTEVICSLICCAMGIPTPTPYLVTIEKAGCMPGLMEGDDPLLFATADAEHPTFKAQIKRSDAIVKLLIDWAHASDSAVFDEQVGNTDRNQGNILMSSNGDCCLIDHGFAFDPKVPPSLVQPKNLFADLLPYCATATGKQKDPLVTVSQSLPKLNGVPFQRLLKYAQGEAYASPEHIQHVYTFYTERLNHIRDIFDLRFGKAANLSLPL